MRASGVNAAPARDDAEAKEEVKGQVAAVAAVAVDVAVEVVVVEEEGEVVEEGEGWICEPCLISASRQSKVSTTSRLRRTGMMES